MQIVFYLEISFVWLLFCTLQLTYSNHHYVTISLHSVANYNICVLSSTLKFHSVDIIIKTHGSELRGQEEATSTCIFQTKPLFFRASLHVYGQMSGQD